MEATTVAAAGLAETEYTIANFSVSLSAKGTTVPTAKSRLKSQIEALNAALTELKEKLALEFVKNSVRTSSNVQEDWNYSNHKNEMVGYVVTYSVSFQISELDKVNEVFDALTSLSNVRVANPTFGLKPAQREKLSKKALKNAFDKARDRFETECQVLGLNAEDFEICSWEATYHDSQRGDNVGRRLSARALSNSLEGAPIAAAASALGGGSSDQIDLVSGLAEVNVNLEVGYARKHHTVRVGSVKVSE
jgi:Uncharacterized conserved protein